MATRKYELKRRAESREQTRQRIVEAAAGLHSTVGPARTSVAAIAASAGVQRHTVYAHFPDDESLFRACSGHWRATHPFPDPAPWLALADPERRLRRALIDVYAWYTGVEEALVLFARDAELFPELRAKTEAEQRALADALAAGFARRRAVRAAVGHALHFETWRSLVRSEGLPNRRAAELMVALVRDAAAA